MTERIIDCDVHCASPSIDDLLPHLDEYWHTYVLECGFSRPAGIAYSYPANAPTTGPGSGGSTLDELRAHLDALGASHAVVNCFYGLEGIRNRDFASAMAAAVNDWLAQEWLAREDRLRPGLLVKAEDPSAAAHEIERRAGDPRFVHVLLPARSERPYGQRSYWPVLEAAAAQRLPVAIHFGGCPGNPPSPVGWPTYYLEEYVGMAYAFEAQLTSLIAEGVFERFPDLRVVLAESGFTWLPSIMWRLDKEWKGLRREIPWVTTAPSQTIRSRVRATVQPIDGPGDPNRLARVLDQIGSDDVLMFSSDHPHRHASGFDEAFDGVLDEPQRRAALSGNAASLYGL